MDGTAWLGMDGRISYPGLDCREFLSDFTYKPLWHSALCCLAYPRPVSQIEAIEVVVSHALMCIVLS